MYLFVGQISLFVENLLITKRRIMMKALLCIFFMSLVKFSFSQEQLIQTVINKNIKMYAPTSLSRINGRQAIGKFGNDFAPKAAWISANERTVLSVTEIFDTVGFYQPGYKKKKVLARDITIEKSFYLSSILAYAKEVVFHQDAIKTIHKRPFITFEFEGIQEFKTKKGTPVEKKFYRYLQYCFVKNRKYIFNFSCPFSELTYWSDTVKTIMESVKITK